MTNLNKFNKKRFNSKILLDLQREQGLILVLPML